MKVCPKCKSTNCIEEDRFCYKDGTELVEMARCGCGREISEGIDIYCSKCGVKVGEQANAARS